MAHQPKFELNNKIISLVAEISRLIGIASVSTNLNKNPQLRRNNRIKTIHDSLAIEQNTLSLEQVTSVINGKAVIAPPKDIEEVKNAFEIYEILDTLNPYSVDDLLKSHSVMMRGLVAGAGTFRTKPVGVVDNNSGEVIHIGTLPNYVPNAVLNLLEWLKTNDTHPVIKSCIFHYEFEVIHPFLDGNGRIGRLWQTLILSKYEPIFAYLPVESMIRKKQNDYYSIINQCDYENNSTKFIEFMLETIKEATEEASLQKDIKTDIQKDKIQKEIIILLKKNQSITQMELAEKIGVNVKTISRKMKVLQDRGIIKRTNGKRNGKWDIIK